MLPGDEPTLDNPTVDDLLIAARATDHAPRVVRVDAIATALQAALTNASSEAAGLMSTTSKIKLDAIPDPDDIAAALVHAGREHIGMVVDGPTAGELTLLWNMRTQAELIGLVAWMGTGTAQMDARIDGIAISAWGTPLLDTTPRLVWISAENDIPFGSQLSVNLSNVSSDAANLRVFGLIDFELTV